MRLEITADFEAVLVIVGYWDEPRSGIALFRGDACYFECIFDEELDDYSNHYRLTHVTPATLAIYKEKDEIFRRWRAVFDSGKVDRTSGPALPNEKSRYQALTHALDEKITMEAGEDLITIGEFSPICDPQNPKINSNMKWQVKWSADA
jgi:hypothetical protein